MNRYKQSKLFVATGITTATLAVFFWPAYFIWGLVVSIFNFDLMPWHVSLTLVTCVTLALIILMFMGLFKKQPEFGI